MLYLLCRPPGGKGASHSPCTFPASARGNPPRNRLSLEWALQPSQPAGANVLTIAHINRSFGGPTMEGRVRVPGPCLQCKPPAHVVVSSTAMPRHASYPVLGREGNLHPPGWSSPQLAANGWCPFLRRLPMLHPSPFRSFWLLLFWSNRFILPASFKLSPFAFHS
jgi:hypothetical protein